MTATDQASPAQSPLLVRPKRTAGPFGASGGAGSSSFSVKVSANGFVPSNQRHWYFRRLSSPKKMSHVTTVYARPTGLQANRLPVLKLALGHESILVARRCRNERPADFATGRKWLKRLVGMTGFEPATP